MQIASSYDSTSTPEFYAWIILAGFGICALVDLSFLALVTHCFSMGATKRVGDEAQTQARQSRSVIMNGHFKGACGCVCLGRSSLIMSREMGQLVV